MSGSAQPTELSEVSDCNAGEFGGVASLAGLYESPRQSDFLVLKLCRPALTETRPHHHSIWPASPTYIQGELESARRLQVRGHVG